MTRRRISLGLSALCLLCSSGCLRAQSPKSTEKISHEFTLTADAGRSTLTLYNINGQIKVKYPASFAADLHFKSMHGELYTDFPNAEVLPAQVTKNRQGQGDGTVYKLSKDTAVRIGKGGPDFHFETLNGDVTITKQ